MGRKKSPTPPRIDADGGLSFQAMASFSAASRSNLIHWTNIGIIRADFAETEGPGYPRRFSPLNLAEVQIAAQLNRFRLPTAVIRYAVGTFRDFHELCIAVAPSNGPEPPEAEALTDAERQAVEHAYAKQFVRRDERFAAEDKTMKVSSLAHAMRVERANPGWADAENEKSILYHSRRWHRFLNSGTFRRTHFYGLFVNPDEDVASEIEIEPIDLKDAVDSISIVVNLESIVDHTQAVTGNRL